MLLKPAWPCGSCVKNNRLDCMPKTSTQGKSPRWLVFFSSWSMLVKTRGHAVCVEVMWLFPTWCDFREVAWPCSDVTFGDVMWLRAAARTKHQGFGPLLEVAMSKKCTPLWRKAPFQVKMYKTHHGRTTFGSWDVEKVHAVVARSTFPSQNVQNTMVGPLLEVAMSKKCTPLCREAHFQVKSVKNWWSRTTFGGSDVEKVSKKCTPLWREAHLEVKSVKNWGFWAFFDVLMSKK